MAVSLPLFCPLHFHIFSFSFDVKCRNMLLWKSNAIKKLRSNHTHIRNFQEHTQTENEKKSAREISKKKTVDEYAYAYIPKVVFCGDIAMTSNNWARKIYVCVCCMHNLNSNQTNFDLRVFVSVPIENKSIRYIRMKMKKRTLFNWILKNLLNL